VNKPGSIAVSASGDWQSTKVRAKPGDFVAYESKGTWTRVISGSDPFFPDKKTCGPEGLPERAPANPPGGKPKLPIGCLLVRTGEGESPFMAAGSGVVQATGEGGRVSARCNLKDNSKCQGTLTLRVVLIPRVEL